MIPCKCNQAFCMRRKDAPDLGFILNLFPIPSAPPPVESLLTHAISELPLILGGKLEKLSQIPGQGRSSKGNQLFFLQRQNANMGLGLASGFEIHTCLVPWAYSLLAAWLLPGNELDPCRQKQLSPPLAAFPVQRKG